MRKEIPYLSEEELEQLILQVEQSELVAAPPSLYEDCIQGGKISVQETLEDKREKAIEFRRYCFQVITSVAAAIAIVFGLPHMEVKPKTEVLSRQEVQERSFTREEKVIEKLDGSTNLADILRE